MDKKVKTPSTSLLQRYLDKWEKLDNYKEQERSLEKLFMKTYPLNDNMDDVLVKVCCLNDFYSTHIFSPFKVARHIVSLKIDSKIKKGDLSIVNKIAKVKMKGVKTINFYSFATKYCSHHNPTHYPIYDYYIDRMLVYLKRDKFTDFSRKDLKDYSSFKKVLLKFKRFYGLDDFTIRDIDKYLWLAGKKYFSRLKKT